jgi:hypothetical protein
MRKGSKKKKERTELDNAEKKRLISIATSEMQFIIRRRNCWKRPGRSGC